MKRYFSHVLLPFVFVLSLLAPDLTQAAKYGDVSVSVVQLYKTHEPTRRGYAGYCFLVKNDGTSSHTVQIKIPFKNFQRSGLVSSRTVKLSPGGSSEVWIYQPAINIHGNGSAVVTIDGKAYRDDPIQDVDTGLHISLESDSYSLPSPAVKAAHYIPTEFENAANQHANKPNRETREAATPAMVPHRSAYMPGHGSLNNNSTMAVLVSRGLDGNLRDRLQRYLANCNMIQSAQKTSEWPTSWLAYSQFEGVILNDEEFDTLAPATVSALADYISVGGAVWVRPNKKSQAELTKPMKKLQRAAISGMGVFLRGKSGTNFKMQAIANLQCGNAWQDAAYAGKLLPAMERNVAPIRLFLVMLIFYAIAIGPVLQFILKIKRRRIWMLWIIPVTAVILCGVVFAGSYFAEGFYGSANFRNITVLDQTVGRASTVGLASFYSPLSDGDGLEFSTATILQPQWASQGHRRNESEHEVAMDWTNGQHLTTGWLQAKTPIVFRLWKAEPRREKLTIRKDKSGKITATNALGADAQGLKLCMPNGTRYMAETLPMGETCTLRKTDQKNDFRLPSVKNFCLKAPNWCFSDDPGTIQKQRVRLKPGTYQVMLDGHPFVSTGITNPAKDQGKTLVLGRFEVEKK